MRARSCRRCRKRPVLVAGLCRSCAEAELKARPAGTRLERIASRRARRAEATGGPGRHLAPEPMARAKERLLKVADVADRLALSKESVYRLVRRGRLAGLKVGAALRIKTSSVEAFLSGKR